LVKNDFNIQDLRKNLYGILGNVYIWRVFWGDNEALARVVKELWANRDKNVSIVRSAQEHLESHFSLSQLSQKCIEHYKELLTDCKVNAFEE